MTPRERLLVGLVLPLALVGAGYRFGWVPLTEARAARIDEIAAYRQLTLAAQGANDRPAVAAVAIDPTPLATRVTQSAEAAGITLTRLEPEGAGLRLTLPETPFDTVIGWLARLEPDHGIRIAAAEIDRRTAPGTVSARILVEALQ